MCMCVSVCMCVRVWKGWIISVYYFILFCARGGVIYMGARVVLFVCARVDVSMYLIGGH